MLRTLCPLTFAVTAGLAQTAPPAGSISGVVKNGATGDPVENAAVWVQTPGGQIIAHTDAAGRYTLPDVPPGDYWLGARADRMSAQAASIGTEPEKLIRLGPGQDLASIELVFQPRGSISGKVVDENKEPVAGIPV